MRLMQLLSGKFKRTQTSITDSSAPYKVKSDRVGLPPFSLSLTVRHCFSLPPPPCVQGNTWTLIDLPGHDSLRHQYLEKFKSAAR